MSLLTCLFALSLFSCQCKAWKESFQFDWVAIFNWHLGIYSYLTCIYNIYYICSTYYVLNIPRSPFVSALLLLSHFHKCSLERERDFTVNGSGHLSSIFSGLIFFLKFELNNGSFASSFSLLISFICLSFTHTHSLPPKQFSLTIQRTHTHTF